MLLGRGAGGYVFVAVPGVLCVHILGMAIALQLEMGGDGDSLPAPAIHVQGEEIRDCLPVVLRAVEMPVEGKAGGRAVRQQVEVVGVGRLAVVLEKFRGEGGLIAEYVHSVIASCKKCLRM